MHNIASVRIITNSTNEILHTLHDLQEKIAWTSSRGEKRAQSNDKDDDGNMTANVFSTETTVTTLIR